MILAFIGKSASGKDTLVNAIKQYFGATEMRSVATRAMRPGEVDGEKYFFLSKEAFEELREKGELAEEVHYNGNSYGITKEEVRRCVESPDIICVVAIPKGVDDIEAVCGKGSVYRVYVDCDDNLRRQRFLSRLGREATPSEKEELEKRIKEDEKVFEGADKNCNHLLFNNENTLINNPEAVARSVVEGAKEFFCPEEEHSMD